MTFANYREWRQALHNVQIKIEELDVAYFDNPGEKTYKEYCDTDRKVLTDELEALYKVEHLYTT